MHLRPNSHYTPFLVSHVKSLPFIQVRYCINRRRLFHCSTPPKQPIFPLLPAPIFGPYVDDPAGTAMLRSSFHACAMYLPPKLTSRAGVGKEWEKSYFV